MSKEKWVAIEDTINLIDDHIEIRNCCAEYVCKKLNEQDQKIKELERRLSNCIELPKYEKGQKIYYIRGGKIEEAYFQRFNNWITADVILNPHEVTDDDGYTDVDYDFDMVSPEQMFKTREDAKAKLRSLEDDSL